jgi:hypothetical protein
VRIPVIETNTLSLLSEPTGRWMVFRFETQEQPGQDDLADVLEALAKAAAETDLPVCVVLENLKQPNSRVLAALVGLLTAKDGSDRRVAVAGAEKGWLDMLDILGVTGRFVVLGSLGELAESEGLSQ